MIESQDPREVALLALAHTYGATVHRVELTGHERGRYEADQQRIFIRRGMSVAQEVSALAHEVVHARRGDHGPQHPEVEAFVQEEAARLILTDVAYRATADAYGPNNIDTIARILNVTPSIIRAWQRQDARNRFTSHRRAHTQEGTPS